MEKEKQVQAFQKDIRNNRRKDSFLRDELFARRGGRIQETYRACIRARL